MVVDYSKWDKLELSDDSDVEVHPNVDKRSFIRWKQRDIHEKREVLKHRMKQLELNHEMNGDLLKLLDNLLEASKSQNVSTDIMASVKLAMNDSKKIKPESTDIGTAAPSYPDMLESLLIQIKASIESGKNEEVEFIEKLKEHRKQLAETIEKESKEYIDLQEERSRHIVSEDLRTGFDSTLINKEAHDTNSSGSSGTKSKTTEQVTEVLNQPNYKEKEPSEVDPDISASSDAVEFSKIPVGNYDKCAWFLKNHPNIMTEHDKDGLMLLAFDEQLAGKTNDMKRTVHNALLLQYSVTIGKQATDKLFERLNNPMHPAYQAFMKDVDNTVSHIIKRCEVISSERSEASETGAVEQIQLHAVDPDTEIVIKIPQPEDQGYDVYEKFDPAMKKAIETKSLDEINKVLANMELHDAEELVRQFDECGVLMVEEKIYDAELWQAKKEQLEQHVTDQQGNENIAEDEEVD